MTPARLRTLMATWPDPRDVVAAIRTERAAEVLTAPDGAPARARSAGARARLERARRPRARRARLLRARRRACSSTGTDDYPIDTGIEDHPRGALRRGRPTRRARPAARRDRRDARRDPARTRRRTRARRRAGAGRRHRGQRARDRHRRRRARGRARRRRRRRSASSPPGSTSCTRAGTTLLHDACASTALLVSEYRYGTGPAPGAVPRPQPDHRRALRRARGGRGDRRRRLAHHRRPGDRVRAGRVRVPGVAAQPVGTRDERADPGGAHVGGRSRRRARRCSASPPASGGRPRGRGRPPAPPARSGPCCGALGGEPATVDELTSRTGLDPGPVAVAVAGLVRSGHLRRAHGLLWPRVTSRIRRLRSMHGA